MTIVAAIIMFGVLIFVHELGHFGTAKAFGVKVHEFSIGMGPAVFKRKRGETDYSLRALPIGGFVKLEGEDEASDDPRSFGKCSPVKRIVILIAGGVMNILTGFLIFVLVFGFADSIAVPHIERVVETSAAEEAGLAAGDVIKEINGKSIHIYSDITLGLYENADNEAQVVIERAGEEMTFFITPRELEGRTILGFEPAYEAPTFTGVIYNAFYNTIFVVRLVFFSLRELITGNVGLSQMAGPVGIVSEIGEAAKYGVLSVMNFAALIAVNLGIMNLLPLPALDGGRIFFIFAEMIRKKPIKPEIEGYVHAIGLVLLLILMVVITGSDILKLFG